MAPSTTRRTLYRLVGVEPTVESMIDALDAVKMDELHADFDICSVAGTPALFVHGSSDLPAAPWFLEVNRATGLEVSRPVVRPVGVLLLAVDGEVYAIGFDQGYRLLHEDLVDQRFGLSFAARRVDPERVRDVVAQTPSAGRTDATQVAGGGSIWGLGVVEHAQIVRRLGGSLRDIELTARRSSRTKLSVAEGGVGLRLRIGIEGTDLVADIRAIARTLRVERPVAELAFVDHVVPIKNSALRERLFVELDALLGRAADGTVKPSVPGEYREDNAAAHAFRVRINSLDEGPASEEFDLDYTLCRARTQRAGTRVTALREGTVTLYGHSRTHPEDTISRSSALKWIETEIHLQSRRFHLMDGEWYEIDPEYLKSIRSHVERLIVDAPSVALPAWTLGDDERAYNASVPVLQPGYICLDRDNVRTELHRGNGVEVCDLLSPENHLIMVKRAKGSAALSHLFNQARVAVQTLRSSPEARKGFAERVASVRNGRALPENFQPQVVVLAIMLKDGVPLSADTLFPFSQVALVQVARELESSGLRVEVVGIDAAPAATPPPPKPGLHR